MPSPAHHRHDLTLKFRNFGLRCGPGSRSQWRILPRDRLLQIFYFLTHVGDFLVDISGHGSWFGLSLMRWFCLSKTSKRKLCSFYRSDRRELPAKRLA
jgi:hypothetical protein